METRKFEVEIDDWIIPKGTQSVQKVIDIELIDGKLLYYTNANVCLVREDFNTLDEECDENDYIEILDSTELRELAKNYSLN